MHQGNYRRDWALKPGPWFYGKDGAVRLKSIVVKQALANFFWLV